VAPLSTVFLPLAERSLLVCTCLLSGWHKLWAFTRFLEDEDDTTPDFRGFSISHEKQTVNCRQSIPQHIIFIIYFVCIKIPLHKDPKSRKALGPRLSG
jgi:hypothetical protein